MNSSSEIEPSLLVSSWVKRSSRRFFSFSCSAAGALATRAMNSSLLREPLPSVSSFLKCSAGLCFSFPSPGGLAGGGVVSSARTRWVRPKTAQRPRSVVILCFIDSTLRRQKPTMPQEVAREISGGDREIAWERRRALARREAGRLGWRRHEECGSLIFRARRAAARHVFGLVFRFGGGEKDDGGGGSRHGFSLVSGDVRRP